jgi:hypothetical protein
MAYHAARLPGQGPNPEAAARLVHHVGKVLPDLQRLVAQAESRPLTGLETYVALRARTHRWRPARHLAVARRHCRLRTVRRRRCVRAHRQPQAAHRRGMADRRRCNKGRPINEEYGRILLSGDALEVSHQAYRRSPTGDGGVFVWVMRLNLIERLSLELVGPLQPALEQFLDHPGHARLFRRRRGRRAGRCHQRAFASPFNFIRNRGILIPNSAD